MFSFRYSNCHSSNLNGEWGNTLYAKGMFVASVCFFFSSGSSVVVSWGRSHNALNLLGPVWQAWQGYYTPLTFTQMAMREKTTCAPGSQVFAYTGGTQSWTVPAACTRVTVMAWGGGGGGYNSAIGEAGTGGGAGYVTGVLTVTPGVSLTVVVGNGGSWSSTSTGGLGGAGWIH